MTLRWKVCARPLWSERAWDEVTPQLGERVAIRTERLQLRPFGPDDVEDRFAYSRDPGFARFLGRVPPTEIQDAERAVARRILTPWGTEAFFAVVLDTTVIGGIGLHVKESDEIGVIDYGITSAHWGKGLVPEAAQAVIDWGFPHYGLAKIYAVADLRNRQSWRVMEKLGMTREGVLRSNHKARGGERVDDVYYGLLREEWERGNHRSSSENSLVRQRAG